MKTVLLQYSRSFFPEKLMSWAGFLLKIERFNGFIICVATAILSWHKWLGPALRLFWKRSSHNEAPLNRGPERTNPHLAAS
jgi:hypothetical protein